MSLQKMHKNSAPMSIHHKKRDIPADSYWTKKGFTINWIARYSVEQKLKIKVGCMGSFLGRHSLMVGLIALNFHFGDDFGARLKLANFLFYCIWKGRRFFNFFEKDLGLSVSHHFFSSFKVHSQFNLAWTRTEPNRPRWTRTDLDGPGETRMTRTDQLWQPQETTNRHPMAFQFLRLGWRPSVWRLSDFFVIYWN